MKNNIKKLTIIGLYPIYIILVCIVKTLYRLGIFYENAANNILDIEKNKI